VKQIQFLEEKPKNQWFMEVKRKEDRTCIHCRPAVVFDTVEQLVTHTLTLHSNECNSLRGVGTFYSEAKGRTNGLESVAAGGTIGRTTLVENWEKVVGQGKSRKRGQTESGANVGGSTLAMAVEENQVDEV
jgi:hypothetical protein